MASQVALFGIVVGVAMLLSGIGFAILVAFGAIGGIRPEEKPAGTAAAPQGGAAIPTA